MHLNMDINLNVTVQIGLNMATAQVQKEINKWQKFLILLSVFGMEKSKGTKSMIEYAEKYNKPLKVKIFTP